jgi:hypothetical protein
MCIGLHAKHPLFLFGFNESLTFWTDFLKYSNINFQENPTSRSHVPCESTDRRTDTNDEANSSFSQLYERA